MSSDSEVPRVRFAPPPAATQALRREREAVRDRFEARRDQHEFDEAKHRVEKHVITKGAGPFEADGAWDDDEEDTSRGKR